MDTKERTRRFVPRPSPAMVVACIALFVALSGAGYAAYTLPRNSVGTAQLKANAVTSVKIKNGQVRAADVGVNQITGAHVNEAALAQVPLAANADTLDGLDSTAFAGAGHNHNSSYLGIGATAANAQLLDGIDSTGFIRGGGRVVQNRFHPTAYVNYNLLSVPGFGSLLGGCNADGYLFFDFHNTSGGTLDVMVDNGASNPTYYSLANGENPYVPGQFDTRNEALTMQLSSGTKVATLIVTGHGVDTGTAASDCFINAVGVTT
jgi:hypothetical protein